MEQITREEMIGLIDKASGLLCFYCEDKTSLELDEATAALQAAEPVAWIEIRDCDCEECEGEQDVTTDPLWAKHYPDKWTPLFTLPCPPAKASHWSANNPGRADQYMGEALAARRALGFSEDAEDVAPIDITNAIVELRQPATELAPESWREELETIAEILEADGDEWHCAARIRKMLTASPAKAQVPEGYRAVPATPTPDMTMQGALAGVSHANGEFSQKGAEAVYKAMLAASPAPDHSGDGNEMVEVPFHKLALGTRFRYTSIPESEYVKISATQVARWQDDMAIAGWAGQGVYSFDEKDRTDTKVLVAVPIGLRQQKEQGGEDE